MNFVKGLKCKECGERYEASLRFYCDECFGPVELKFDLAGAVEALGRGSVDVFSSLSLLPEGFKAGSTPLVRAERLGKRLGIQNLYLKDEGASMLSHSFKDRVVASALGMAKSLGIKTIAAASTGNLANALAVQAVDAGMDAVIFVPEGTDYGKIAQAVASGCRIFEVAGNYDDANRLCSEVQEALGWAVVNGNLKPYYLEGAKSLLFEIMALMEDMPPSAIVAPMGGGGLMRMLKKGLDELKAMGMLKEETALYGAQAAGCSPIVSAVKAGTEDISPVKPDTAIGAIAIGDPPDGAYAARAIMESGGKAEAVLDADAMEMLEFLREDEGISTGGAGAVALAAAASFVKSGDIAGDTPVVVILTDGQSKAAREQARPGNVSKIEANLAAFRAIWEENT
ncbi:MAG: threonine synthase [Proteobacteria bacterium]|nr:threonine synthase [Pseudomonadota bacterium]